MFRTPSQTERARRGKQQFKCELKTTPEPKTVTLSLKTSVCYELYTKGMNSLILEEQTPGNALRIHGDLLRLPGVTEKIALHSSQRHRNMMLSFFLLFLLCDCTVTQETTTEPIVNTNNNPTPFPVSLTTAELYPPELEAKPDYPVTAGQKVYLHCKAPSHVILQRLETQTWINVSRGGDLTLTEPSESGVYRCHSRVGNLEHVSPDHSVLIVSTHAAATAAVNLGIAAFVLSLLALILNFAILYRLIWQRPGNTPTTSNTAEKGLPKPEKSTKEALPKADSDEVYMNYTSTNQAYTDLTPSNMTAENVYSSLS
ncbi:uncharacterized protein V6R79_014945 [Siganus canaliculatus]